MPDTSATMEDFQGLSYYEKKKKNWEEDLQRTEKHNDLPLVLGTRHHSTIHQALDTGASPCDRRTACYLPFVL